MAAAGWVMHGPMTHPAGSTHDRFVSMFVVSVFCGWDVKIAGCLVPNRYLLLNLVQEDQPQNRSARGPEALLAVLLSFPIKVRAALIQLLFTANTASWVGSIATRTRRGGF